MVIIYHVTIEATTKEDIFRIHWIVKLGGILLVPFRCPNRMLNSMSIILNNIILVDKKGKNVNDSHPTIPWPPLFLGDSDHRI